MTIHKTSLVAGAALLGVAACGSTSSTFGPTTENVDIPAGITVTFNGPTSVTFSDGLNDYELTAANSDTKGAFVSIGGGAAAGGREVVRNSDDTAILVKGGAVYGDPLGAILIRLDDTTLPVTGTATYTGNSASFLVGGGVSISEGEVTLNVSFTDGTIDGLIDARREFGSSSGSRGDIVLNPAPISNGGFSGTTTGGYIGGTQAGTYSGLFTGASGETLVGEWQYDDGVDQVQGVFSAEQTP